VKSTTMLDSLARIVAGTLLAANLSRRAGFSFSHARMMSQITEAGASVLRDRRLQWEKDTLYPALSTADLKN